VPQFEKCRRLSGASEEDHEQSQWRGSPSGPQSSMPVTIGTAKMSVWAERHALHKHKVAAKRKALLSSMWPPSNVTLLPHTQLACGAYAYSGFWDVTLCSRVAADRCSALCRRVTQGSKQCTCHAVSVVSCLGPNNEANAPDQSSTGFNLTKRLKKVFLKFRSAVTNFLNRQSHITVSTYLEGTNCLIIATEIRFARKTNPITRLSH
jgi:hypothetical protein